MYNGDYTNIQAGELTKTMDDAMPKAYKVSILAPGDRKALLGTSGTYTLTLVNQGIMADTYVISASAKLGWANLSQVPSSVTLQPSQQISFPITVTVPLIGSIGQEEAITVTAQSSHVSDGNITRIAVVPELPATP